MNLHRKISLILLVFSFIIMVSFLTPTQAFDMSIPQTNMKLLKIQSTGVNSDQIEIQNIILEGSIVSIILEDELATLTGLDQYLYILVLFDGNGDPTAWEAAMLFSYTNSSLIYVHWMIGDPFVGGIWIQGFEGTHYQVNGNLIQLTFIEFTALGYSETYVAALPLLSMTVFEEGSNDFSTIMFGFLQLIPEPTESSVMSTTTSSVSSSTTSSATSISSETNSSSTTQPSTKETTTSGSEQSKPVDQISSGFEVFTILLVAIPIILAKRLRKSKSKGN